MSADSRSRFSAAPLVGFAVALVLMVLAAGIPYLWQWNVHVFSWPPLHAEWDPRVGPGSIAAVILGVLAIRYAVQVTERMPWRLLVLASFVLSAAWLTALAAVDGLDGIGVILNDDYEYLNTARRVDDVSATLHEYVSRIPYSHPQNWPVHLAGHPPGALLFFVLLVRLGLDTGLEAGFAVLLVAATVPAALLLTLQRLGAEARRPASGSLPRRGSGSNLDGSLRRCRLHSGRSMGDLLFVSGDDAEQPAAGSCVGRTRRSAPRLLRHDVLRLAVAWGAGSRCVGRRPRPAAPAVGHRWCRPRGLGICLGRVRVVGSLPRAARALLGRGGESAPTDVLAVGQPGRAVFQRRASGRGLGCS
ncbi:MAG: hypothetical protein WKF73_20725 [Nocardioidaceae bacterium]